MGWRKTQWDGCKMDENIQKLIKNKFLKGALLGALVMLSIMLIALAVLLRNPQANSLDVATDKKLEEINELIMDNFLFQEDIEATSLLEGLYRGYVAELGDIYSEYYSPKEADEVTENIKGQYSGVGAVLSQDAETKIVTMIHIYKNSPAERAGLKDGDIVYKVEGEEIIGLTLEEVALRLRGPVDTDVEVTVYRGVPVEEVTVTATREQIDVETVIYEMKDDSVGYIRVTEFNQVTLDQYREALAELKDQGIKGLVVDLRNNPGGSLNVVTDMVSEMLPAKTGIFTMKDSKGNEEVVLSTGKESFDLPTVVLVNQFSASASEIYAGAMQDAKAAKIVGMNTFGKGIIQQIFELGDGSSVKLTIAEYFTPDGNKIHGIGVVPDVEVKFEADKTNEDADNQLEEALKIIKEDL